MNFTRENLQKTKEKIVIDKINKEKIDKIVNERVEVVSKKLVKKNIEGVIYE